MKRILLLLALLPFAAHAQSVNGLSYPYTASFSALTSSQSATGLVPAGAPSGAYQVSGCVTTTTAGSAGTVTLTLAWNNGASQSVTTSTAALATLGANQCVNLPISIASSTAITWSTTVASAAGSPQYAVNLSALWQGAANTGSAAVTWTKIQATNSAATTTSSPFTAAFGSSTTAGNLLMCGGMAYISSGGTTLAVSDTPNSTYTNLTYANPNDSAMQPAYVLSGAGGASSPLVTANMAITHIWNGCGEFHRSTGTASLDLQGTFTSTSTSSPTTASITTTGTSDLVIAYLADFNTNTATCNSPWLTLASNSDQGAFVGGYVVCYQLNVTAGSISGAFTLSGADADWVAGIAAFK